MALYDAISSVTNVTNQTEDHLPGGYDTDLEVEDTNWILTSSFIIFTMQTGFGMLESGCVSIKNEVNIMMKNVVDIVLGGLTYWMFGYGISFGKGPLTNPFIAIGGFFIDPSVGNDLMGPVFAAFLFQLSFATTATTIVSGAMAERCDFKAYCVFSLLNTVVYCIPAGWVWGEHGFLYQLGAVDIAGSGPVHLIGGSAAFASAAMLGPRLGRYSSGRAPLPPGSPVNAVLGLFVLWWGWLAFNSGSTYGVSGAKWQYAARAAVMTMIGSFGGGIFGLIYSLIRFKGKLDLIDLINSILGALVSITAGCFLYHAWEALLIGTIGGAVACLTMPLVDLMGVDDPVGASSVHGFSGIWGVIAVGLFADNPVPLATTKGLSGLFKGGGWYLLGVQVLAALCLAAWGVLSTALLLWIIGRFRNIRMSEMEELLGADVTEHMIRHGQDDVTTAMNILEKYMDVEHLKRMIPIGSNPGHKTHLMKKYPGVFQAQTTPTALIDVQKYPKIDETKAIKLIAARPPKYNEKQNYLNRAKREMNQPQELSTTNMSADYRSLFYVGKDAGGGSDIYRTPQLPRLKSVGSTTPGGGNKFKNRFVIRRVKKNNRSVRNKTSCSVGQRRTDVNGMGWID